MSDPIPRESISAGLRHLADLVDAGLLDERGFPTLPLDVMVNLASPAAVARFARKSGVDTQSVLTPDGAQDDELLIRAILPLGGVSVEAFTVVPLTDLDAAMAEAGDLLHGVTR